MVQAGCYSRSDGHRKLGLRCLCQTCNWKDVPFRCWTVTAISRERGPRWHTRKTWDILIVAVDDQV